MQMPTTVTTAIGFGVHCVRGNKCDKKKAKIGHRWIDLSPLHAATTRTTYPQTTNYR